MGKSLNLTFGLGGSVKRDKPADKAGVIGLPLTNLHGNAKAHFLVLLLLLYAAAYGWILVSTGFMPYVMDNNESFSVLVHASNMYHFSFWKSFGLTDEAYGPDPVAHPFIHTHQGNMPRLFGFFIYILGARSIESQIVITTAVIGTLSVLMMYFYFTKLAGPLFGFICSSLLITDYVLFMQWQIVTYRVWYSFLFFLALLSIHGMSGPRSRLWKWLMAATYLLLFYSELVFAGLMTVFCALYALVIYRRALPVAKQIFVVQFKAAATAIVILFTQLSVVFGPSVVLQDFRLTFFSRNSSGDTAVQQLKAFFDVHNIVYWYNVVDATPYRNRVALIRSQTNVNFQVYTPVLTLIAVILISAWLLGERRSVSWAVVSTRIRKAVCLKSLRACWPLAALALVLGALVLCMKSGAQLTFNAILGVICAALLLTATVRRGPRLICYLAGLYADDPPRVIGAIRLVAVLCAGILLCFLPDALSHKNGLVDNVGLLDASLLALYVTLFLGVACLAVRPGLVIRLSRAAEVVDFATAALDQQLIFRTLAAASLSILPILLLLFRFVLGSKLRIMPWVVLHVVFSASFILSFFYWKWFSHVWSRLRLWGLQLSLNDAGDSEALRKGFESITWLRAVRVVATIAAAFLVPFTLVLLDARVENGLVFKSYSLSYFIFLCLYLTCCISVVRCALKPGLASIWLRKLSAVESTEANFGGHHPPTAIAGNNSPGSAQANLRTDGTYGTVGQRWESRLRTVLKVGGLFLMLLYVFRVAIVGQNVFGIEPAPGASIWTFPLHALLIGFAAAASTLIIVRLGAEGWTDFPQLRVDTIAALVIFLFVTGNFIQHHWKLYDQDFSIIWMRMFASRTVIIMAKLGVFSAIGVGILMILFGSRRTLGEAGVKGLRKVWIFFLSGEAAYSVIYFLSPGYVLTGYQWRHAPFAVFFTCVIPAMAVCIALLMASQAWHWFRPKAEAIEVPVFFGTFGRALLGVMGSAATFLVIFISGYWVGIQVMYAGLLPPDHYSFLKQLRKPPYKGKTFVVNTYAAPIAAMTGAWAYYDPLITGGYDPSIGNGWLRTDHDYELPHDKRYLWFSDRRNQDYDKPDFYACMAGQDLTAVVAELTHHRNPRKNFYGCWYQGIIANVVRENVLVMDYQLTGADWEDSGYWAILKLDYDYPPYLEQVGREKLDGVNLSVIQDRDGKVQAAADYRFLQLNGEPEAGSTLEVYSSNDTSCDETDPDWQLIYAGPTGHSAELPDGFSGKLQAFVTPKTKHKAGRRYSSQILKIQHGDFESTKACAGGEAPAPPTGLRAIHVTPTTIELNWRRSPGSARYRIEMARGNGVVEHIGNLAGESLAYPSHSVGDVADGKYSFRVTACNTNTGACSWHTPTVTADSSTSEVHVEPVNEIQAYRLSAQKAYLEWRPAAYAQYYLVEMRAKGGSFEAVERADNKLTRERVSDLNPEGEYAFRVRACREKENCADYSPEATLGRYTAVSPPVRLKAERVDTTVVLLTWKRQDGIDNYRIEMAAGQAGEFEEIGAVADRSDYSVTGLGYGRVYRFRIRACRHPLGACSTYSPLAVTGPNE